MNKDWRLIWWSFAKLTAALSIISLIQHTYDIGIIHIFGVFINYYRHMLYPIYDFFQHILHISLPFWYRDLSIVSWFLAASYARVYLFETVSGVHGRYVAMMGGVIPFEVGDDGEIIEEKPVNITHIYVRAYIVCIISGLTLLGILSPAIAVYRYVKLYIEMQCAYLAAVRYAYDKEDSSIVLSEDAHMCNFRVLWQLTSILKQIQGKLLGSYIKYMMHVILIVVVFFIINVGLWSS